MSPVVVFVHLHYAEVWPQIRAHLDEAMAVPFRLVVTTTLDDASFDAPATPYLADMQVMRVENRGRDVRPFLEALRATEPFEIGLKLHGKRSVHRLDGDAWRDALFGSLLPDAPTVADLVSRMRGDPHLAMIAPQNALCSINKHVAGNARAMKAVAGRLSLDLSKATARTPCFVAGTMFWFRRDALMPVADADLDDLFADEKRQTDGTAAHALERLFAVIAEREGGVALPIDALVATAPSSSLEALRQASRERVDRDETYVLVPGRAAAFALRYLRFLVPIYLALPDPLRRSIKAGARRLSPGR